MNTKLARKIALTAIILLIINSCITIKHETKVVNPFNAERYLGTWYEIARFDLRFERNLKNVTATYSQLKNGNIKVLNKGYNTIKNKWTEASGIAKFVDSKSEGRLKVSFFGPFYSPYNVIAIDKNYQYALVVGADTDYMWLLSKEKKMPENIKQDYLKIAKDLGFKTNDLIWVQQD